jgi:hypothetical protein
MMEIISANLIIKIKTIEPEQNISNRYHNFKTEAQRMIQLDLISIESNVCER